MKKNYLKPINSILLAVFLMMGCQKESLLNNVDLADSESARGNHRNECRLTESVFPDGAELFHYNQKGLCDEWTISGWGTLKQEYDHRGWLKRSRIYDETGLFATVHFFYTGKKVTKEIWYYGDTDEVYDEVHYFFNYRGQNIRMESAVYDYYTVNSFDAEGNVRGYEYYSDGNHVYSMRATYNYRPFFKNPRKAIPGIDYGFPYLNATAFASPECISSEKLSTFDELGNSVVLYDYDPRKTSYRRASQDYPSFGRFFNRVTNDWTSQVFRYENCRGRGDCDDVNNKGNGDCDDDANSSSDAPTVAGKNKSATQFILRPSLIQLKNTMHQRKNK